MRTLEQILRLSPEYKRTEYEAVGIGQVEIDGNVFDNYGSFSFIFEKSYIDEDSTKRALDGSMGNLPSAPTLITGHLVIDYSVMSIDYYRKLTKLINSKNEFLVKCYDIVDNKPVRLKMYFAPQEMPKLRTIAHKIQKSQEEWDEWIELVGVDGCSIELIGTNNPLDTLSVTYHKNNPDGTGDLTQGEPNLTIGDEVIIGSAVDWQTETWNGAYKFKYWSTEKDLIDNKGLKYIDGKVYTLDSDLALYAIWEVASIHTLFFNYGIGEPIIQNNEPYTHTEVQSNQSVDLPEIKTPSVTYEGIVFKETQSPYINGGWYKSRIKDENFRVNNGDLYWTDKDDTIYQLFDTQKYDISFISNSEGTRIINVEYGVTILAWEPKKEGYNFLGWYFDEYNHPELKDKKFNGTAPPFKTYLIAKWELK